VRLKSGLESDFAGLGLGLTTERLGLGSLGLGLEHVTESKSWTTHKFRISSATNVRKLQGFLYFQKCAS
jgi:hypothetical protein